MDKKFQFFVAFFGNVAVYYAITLYGFFATLLAPIYFPSIDPNISMMSSLGAFAAGFVMRPLGGLFFGYMGDRYGRKSALLASIRLMIFPTLIISILPAYETIGIFAPICLLVCRMLQGLCAGGEHTGSVIFVIEHSDKKDSCLNSSILTASGTLGAFLAAATGAFFTLSSMPAWGWRVPFLIAALMTIINFFLRRRLQETPAFEEVLKKRVDFHFPLRFIFKNHLRNFLCVVGIGSFITIPLYIVTTYFGSVLGTKTQIGHSCIMLIFSVIMLINTLMLPLMGRLADIWGERKLMLLSAIFIFLLSYPLFVLTTPATFLGILFVQIVITVISLVFVAPSSAFESTLFPIQARFTAIGFGYSLGIALFGGFAPLACQLLVQYTGHDTMASLYLVFGSVLGILGVVLAKPIDDQEKHNFR
jgi:MHS family proline/betaine transporter-like MFS transporter